MCTCLNHHSKFLETYINQGKYNPNNPIIHVLCAHVLKESNNKPNISKPEVTLQYRRLDGLSGGRSDSVCFFLGDEEPRYTLHGSPVWRKGDSVCFLLGDEEPRYALHGSPVWRGSYPSVVVFIGTKPRVQSPLERWPSMTSMNRPKMESRPYEFLLHYGRKYSISQWESKRIINSDSLKYKTC